MIQLDREQTERLATVARCLGATVALQAATALANAGQALTLADLEIRIAADHGEKPRTAELIRVLGYMEREGGIVRVENRGDEPSNVQVELHDREVFEDLAHLSAVLRDGLRR